MVRYNNLVQAYFKDRVAFNMALAIYMEHGSAGIKRGVDMSSLNGVMTEEYQNSIVAVAEMLASADASVVLAFIQRAMDPVKGDDKLVPFLNHCGDEDGVCPICGDDVEYSDNEIDDDGTIAKWECPGCGATGKAGYAGVFSGHYDVQDENGNAFEERGGF